MKKKTKWPLLSVERNRRSVLAALAGATAIGMAITGCAPSETEEVAPAEVNVAVAEVTDVVVAHAAGINGEAIEALLLDFTAATGIEAVGLTYSDTDFGAKMQLAARTGQSEADVILGISPEVFALTKDSGIYANLDTSGWDPTMLAAYQEADLLTENTLVTQQLSGVIVYSDRFAEDPPVTWEDFFDTEKFPGNRGMASGGRGVSVNMEIATLGAGIAPADVNPLDIDRALAKISGLGDGLILWDNAPKGIQDIVNGDTTVGWSFLPAALSAVANSQPVGISVPKGAPIFYGVGAVLNEGPYGAAAGNAFLDWFTTAEAQYKYATGTSFGILVPTAPVVELVPADKRAYLPGAGDFADNYYRFGYDYYAQDNDKGESNLSEVLNRWSEFRAR